MTRLQKRRCSEANRGISAPLLTVIDKDFYSGSGTVAKDEQGPAQRIALQALPARRRQRIDAATKVDRLHRHQDAHVG